MAPVLNSLLEKRVSFCSSLKALSTDTSYIKIGVCCQKLSTLELNFHYWLSSHCIDFKCPTVAKWSTSSLAAIKNHRCASKSGCSYMFFFSLRTSAERVRELFMPLWWKLRPRVNKWVIILYDRLESLPVVLLLMSPPTYCSANLSTFSLISWKFEVSWLSKCM